MWSSRFTYWMAAIGAAVGLGNLWKFPYSVGNGGGSAFVLIYLASIFLVAMPIMMAEMIIGRSARRSAPSSMRELAKKAGATPRWSIVGWMGVISVFFVLSFFSVIAGWSLAYIIKTALGTFNQVSPEQAGTIFDEFLHQPLQMVGWHLLFMSVTVYTVARGVNSGIERVVNTMMPALFVMLLAMVGYAAVTGEFAQALRYLFQPDFSKISGEVALSAVGQAFFSVNVGIGAVLTYAAYLPERVNLARSALIISVGDTTVALLAGLAIFPLVFANGLDPSGGPGLIFVTLSAAFGTMPGGQWAGTMFFVLVFVAALTSSLSMLEICVARAQEHPAISRKLGAIAVGAGAFVVGLATVFSFNYWEDVRWLGGFERFADATPFDLIDYTVTNIMLPLGGMLFSLFVGWRMSAQDSMAQLRMPAMWFSVWRVLVRFVAPAAVGIVFLFNLG